MIFTNSIHFFYLTPLLSMFIQEIMKKRYLKNQLYNLEQFLSQSTGFGELDTLPKKICSNK